MAYPLKELDPAIKAEENPLIFPRDLEEIDHWVSFRIHKYEFDKKEDLPKDTTIQSIYLPIPTALSTVYDQTWNAESIGPVGRSDAVKAIGEGLKAGRGVSDIASDVTASLDRDKMAQGSTWYAAKLAEQEIGAALGASFGNGKLGAAAGALAAEAFKGGMAAAGIVENPHEAILYGGPKMRNHTFQYNFVARDSEETKAIKDIIYAFKYHSSPGVLSNKNFFDYPEMFDLDFNHAGHLFNIGPSVLTSFSVDYHGAGGAIYFDNYGDPAPVSITINLNFQEMFVITKDQIENQNR